GEIPTNTTIPITNNAALVLTNGNIQATEAVSLSNNVTLNNSTITFIGSNPITIGREVTTATPATTTTVNGVSNILTVNIPAGVTIANTLNGTAVLTKNGTGNLNLLNALGSGGSGYSGQFNLDQGIVVAQNSNALGNAGTAVGANGTTFLVQNASQATT